MRGLWGNYISVGLASPSYALENNYKKQYADFLGTR